MTPLQTGHNARATTLADTGGRRQRHDMTPLQTGHNARATTLAVTGGRAVDTHAMQLRPKVWDLIRRHAGDANQPAELVGHVFERSRGVEHFHLLLRGFCFHSSQLF